jgi:hypothetical protein
MYETNGSEKSFQNSKEKQLTLCPNGPINLSLKNADCPHVFNVFNAAL